MRKILVIGAVIGLAAALASSGHAEMVDQIESVEVVQAKDFVESKFAITPIDAPEVERIAFAVGYEPVVKVNYVEVELPAGESTKLANVRSVNIQVPGDYRLTHEVGWRF
ncbi:hypothetical protein JC525_09090 [Alteromonas sp. IB21]|uniref:hypothetical protein n=1 Tax=Alteromonas sp. IB21 TaxID=2779369 RepID=UPI0018E77F87|nr:hypothetical protein [Alteromonas sp. IB21]MBJ2129091.1 hypothetical protein [Alteromonas sp. IB21]